MPKLGKRPVRRVRVVDQVADELREMIINGDLEPGQPLLQIQLAEELGVSRTPLREAFRVLERDGLIRVTNGNQTVVVVELTPAEIIDVYEIREFVDGLAARRLAADGISEEVNEGLLTSLDTMDRLLTRKRLDFAAYGAAHLDFHLGIVLGGSNRHLHELQNIVRISSQMFLPRYFKRQGKGEDIETQQQLRAMFDQSAHDHKRIHELISKGDVEKAETAAREHVRHTIEIISLRTGGES